MKVVLAIVLAALGVFGVITGEADDSPGLQLIGVLLVVTAVAIVVKALITRGPNA